MGTLAVHNLKEGMVLASDASAKGSVLLKTGITLSAKQISLLKAWGVVEVDIVGEHAQIAAVNPACDIPPAVLEQARRAIGALFAHSNCEFAPVKEVLEVAIHRHAITLMKTMKTAS